MAKLGWRKDKWDPQKHRLYAAEFQMRNDRIYQLETFQECVDYAASITSSRWWRSRGYGPVEVRKTITWANAHAFGHSIEIPMSKWAFNKLVIIHELAHTITPDHHGRIFAKAMLAVVQRFLGQDAYVELKENFKSTGVRFRKKTQLAADHPWRKPKAKNPPGWHLATKKARTCSSCGKEIAIGSWYHLSYVNSNPFNIIVNGECCLVKPV